MRQQIEHTIETIRPVLRADGVEIAVAHVEVPAGIVWVTVQVPSGGCTTAADTLIDRVLAGVGQIIADHAPGVSEVRLATTRPVDTPIVAPRDAPVDVPVSVQRT